MNNLIWCIVFVWLAATATVAADPWPCDCYGGIEATGAYWSLLDFSGIPLADGDWAYAAWAGPDGEIDPPGDHGHPTDDDIKLFVAIEQIEYSRFSFTVTTWGPSDDNHPRLGELIYCRIFDGPQTSIGPSNYYADSQLYQVENYFSEEFFCLFPGDPGNGHTNTPVSGGTSVEENVSPRTPAEEILLRNRPNPFNAATEVQYRIPEDGSVDLKIFNIQGQQVRRLVETNQMAGEYGILWDGRDGSGIEMPSGVYVCVIQAGAFKAARKMVLLR